MSKKDNTHYIIIAVAAILCFLVYRYKTKINPTKEPPPPVPTASSQPAAQTEIIDRSEMTGLKSAEFKKKRLAFVAKEKLGMQRMSIPKDKDGSFYLPVEVKVKDLWCQGGEYEGVKSLLRDFDKKSLLVSLESSTRSGEIAPPLRVTLSDLSKGFKHNFRLQMNAKTNDSVTLAICTDRLKLGKCSEHKPADYPRLLALQAKKPLAPVNEDFIFIFHNLFIKDGELVSYGASDFSNNFQKNVMGLLKEEDFELSGFDKNWKTTRIVRSTAVGMQPKLLTLYVTRNNPKCDMR